MQLQIFHQNGFEIRGGLLKDKPYFIAMDIARALEYQDTEAMTRRLDSDEIQNLQIVGFGNRGVSVINESGLYNAILGSKKPQAKAFKKWITSEVLPSIRKQGYYLTPNVESTLIAELRDSNLSKDSLKRELENLKDEFLVTQREFLNFYKFQPKSKVKEHSPETIAKIKELAKSGVGALEIARTLGISESSARKYK